MVCGFVEQRTVDSGDPGGLPEKLEPGCPLFPALIIEIEQSVIDRLPLPDIKQVKEFRDRLGIVCAGTAPDHDGRTLSKKKVFF